MSRMLALVEHVRVSSPQKLAIKLAVVGLSMLVLCLVVAPPSQAATRTRAPTQACASAGSHAPSQSVCRVMPAGGTFSLPIPGTAAVITGVGTPDRAGKAIVISRAPLVCPTLGGFGIRLSTPTSEALLPPLHWTNGTLYYRDRTTGHCVGVASPALAAAPGVYQVVPGSVISSMPRTGGAGNQRPSPIPQLPLAAVLCLLTGVALRLGRRRWRA